MSEHRTPLQTLQEHIVSFAPVVHWLEQHPELDELSPIFHGLTSIGLYADSDEFPMAVRALKDGAPVGTVQRRDDDSWARFERDFGGVTVYAYTLRSAVCEKVVVGTETVEIPDPNAPKVTVEREKVEWRCRPILAGDQAEAVQV